ncbi:MAG: mechanosensitive ion channel [Proteobacteria bacterium]|nr:mechanosensitive ion channel [Pseudomonadota bacterium]
MCTFMFRLWFLGCVLLATIGMVGMVGGAVAQVSGGAARLAAKEVDAKSIKALVEAAREQGYRVVLVPPEHAEIAVENDDGVLSTSTALQVRATRVRNRFLEVLAGVPEFPGEVAAAIKRNDQGMGPFWPAMAILLAVLYLLIGAGARRGLDSWGSSHFMYLFNPTPKDRAEKILYLGTRALMRTISLFVQLAIAGILLVVIQIDGEPMRITGSLVIIWVGIAGFMFIVFQALFAPDAPDHRLIRLGDDAAIGLRNGFRIATWIAAMGGGICMWLSMSGAGHDAHTIGLVAASLVTAILFSVLSVRYHQAIAGAILGTKVEQQPVWRRLLARNWHILAVVYLLLAWTITAVRLLLDLPNPLGLVGGPILAGIAGLTFYAMALLIIDKWFERKHRHTLEAEDGLPVAAMLGGMKHLAEHAAALLSLAGVVLFIVDAWEVRGAEADGYDGASEIVLVGFIAYIAYQAVKIAIDTTIAEETGDMVEAEPGDEGGAVGASRLATLLPIFRNFLLGVIVVIAGMVILSEMGVDIGPLFAGAGVIGLAVGFGAQSLIRDMFSGAFFLLDDAFRRGEYIDLGSVKGSVERISIRSLQLRHHLGPLHTIPFGEIQHLTNYSRDWVMMKLPLRVTYDTDVEKVRKLIKNLGAELMEHPEIGDKFLEPLKSQGVFKMEDSAMIIRVKFMTKPGDQFMVRKLVYARIQELFAQQGIKFAHREVTVRVASDDGRPLSDAEKNAAAGAVIPSLDATGGAGSSDAER